MMFTRAVVYSSLFLASNAMCHQRNQSEDDGADAGGGRTLRYDIIDRHDPATGLSAMMRTTAFPAAIVALMMARGQTTAKGALPQERCIPPELFMKELAARKIEVVESWI